MKWLAAGAIKIIAVAALITAVLILATNQSDGIRTAGKGVDISGVSVGAAIGFIPRFFENLSQGRAAASGGGSGPTAQARP